MTRFQSPRETQRSEAVVQTAMFRDRCVTSDLIARDGTIAGEQIEPSNHDKKSQRGLSLVSQCYSSIPIERPKGKFFVDGRADSICGNVQTMLVHCHKHLGDKRIEALVIALDAERLAGFPSGVAFIEGIGLAIASALRQAEHSSSRSQGAFRGGLAPFRLRRVVALIDSNLESDLPLRDLARAAQLSVYHFSRAFQNATSLSPHQFILRRRVEKASELIRESNLRILDVAFACGFKTQQHFARSFRRVYGVNPTEYRNLLGFQNPERPRLGDAASSRSLRIQNH